MYDDVYEMLYRFHTWVSAESGALPVNRKFILPPVTAFSLLNRSLERDISLTSSD